ncbi:MAG: hypothetical protein FWJ90_14915 [Actinomadura sp.]
MNSVTKVGAYVAGLAVVFGGAAGIGKAVGPIGSTLETASHETASHETASHETASHETGSHKTGGHETGGHETGGHDQSGGHAAEPAHLPGGLQVSEDGYTLVPRRTTLTPGKRTNFTFTVNGPDGRPVTGFTPLHGKRLHLIVARRDLSGFQHLHPTLTAGGVWSVPVTLPKPGVYRFFTDVQPEGAQRQLTLGTDITAPGVLRPTPLPEPEQVAKVDGYEVRLNGGLAPGKTTELALMVSKDGEPVTDLQPYLEAYGHLVALRQGDLAYLHVHPEGEPGDGKTKAGPGITFSVEAPSPGAYRLYLDFKHDGEVRTAEFTVHAGNAEVPDHRPESGPDHDDRPHTH